MELLDSHVSICKFNIKGKTLYVKVNWKDDEYDLFQITVFDGDLVWSGRFSHEFAERFRENVLETKEDYRKNVKSALTENLAKFEYVFAQSESDPESATFSWRKKYGSIGVRVHGAVPVHLDDVNNPEHDKQSLLDFLLEQNIDLKQKIFNHQLNIQLLNSELEQCKSELEKFVNAKADLESSVYSKYIQMLNNKKKRINLLEENIKKGGLNCNDID